MCFFEAKKKILRTIAALRIFWWTIQDSNLWPPARQIEANLTGSNCTRMSRCFQALSNILSWPSSAQLVTVFNKLSTKSLATIHHPSHSYQMVYVCAYSYAEVKRRFRRPVFFSSLLKSITASRKSILEAVICMLASDMSIKTKLRHRH